MVDMQFSVTDTIESSSNKSIYPEKIEEIPKKKLHPIVFLLNVLWMLFCCHANLYYVFGPRIQGPTKGKLASTALGVTVLVAVPTFIYLTNLKNFIKLTFLIDTILIVTAAAGIAFVNLILMFDKGEWHYKVMEIGFSVEIIFYATMTRVMLVNLDWAKWQIIVFKLHLMLNSLMFLISGIYFIYVGFSYTKRMLPAFDNKVHDFMVLFIFSMFSFTYELYNRVTDLDYTGDLRYIYKIKNVDQTLPKKRNSIIQQKRESINSIKLLAQSEQMKEAVRTYKFSKFAPVDSLE